MQLLDGWMDGWMDVASKKKKITNLYKGGIVLYILYIILYITYDLSYKLYIIY